MDITSPNSSAKEKVRQLMSCYTTFPLVQPTVIHSTTLSTLSLLCNWSTEDIERSASPSFSFSTYCDTLSVSSSISPSSSASASPFVSPSASPNRSPRVMRLIQPNEEMPHITQYEWKSLTDIHGPIHLPLSGIKRLYEVFCFHHTNGYMTQTTFYDLVSAANPVMKHSMYGTFSNRLFDLFCEEKNGLRCVEWIIAVAVLCNKTSIMTHSDVLFYIFTLNDTNEITIEQVEHVFANFDSTPEDKDIVLYIIKQVNNTIYNVTSAIWQKMWKNVVSIPYEVFYEKILGNELLLYPIKLDWNVLDVVLPVESP